MKYLSLGLRALLTLAFLGAGFTKLAGAEMMVQTFETIGFGQWFRYTTALVEISGVALLWVPNRQIIGASLFGATMVGAVLAHWLVLEASAAPAILLGLISAAVLWLHRSQAFALNLRD